MIGRLHLITDTQLQDRYSPAELAELAIEGGVDTVQYRDKSGDVRRMIDEAGQVLEVCRAAGVLMLVNDRVDVALAVNADGVHLGRTDMPIEVARRILGPDKVVGGTIRNADHLRTAMEQGADYVGLGPIFTTGSKQVDHPQLGLDGVRQVTTNASIPVICIAGITVASAADVIAAGAYGVAVIGAICNAEDPARAAALLREAIDSGLLRVDG
jgi:thiamine-phosphate pyrophosphorylase